MARLSRGCRLGALLGDQDGQPVQQQVGRAGRLPVQGVSAAGPSLSSARDCVGSCGTLAVTTYEHGARAALQVGTPAADGLELTPGTNQ